MAKSEDLLPLKARGVIVRVEDCQKLGYCMTAIRPFCKRHGIDFRDFVQNGIEGDRLLVFNDAAANELVEEAMRREAEHGRR